MRDHEVEGERAEGDVGDRMVEDKLNVEFGEEARVGCRLKKLVLGGVRGEVAAVVGESRLTSSPSSESHTSLCR